MWKIVGGGKYNLEGQRDGRESEDNLMRNKSLERVPEGWVMWKG